MAKTTFIVGRIDERGNCFRLIDHSSIEVLPHSQSQVFLTDPPAIFVSRHRRRRLPDSRPSKNSVIEGRTKGGGNVQAMCLPVSMERSRIESGPVYLYSDTE